MLASACFSALRRLGFAGLALCVLARGVFGREGLLGTDMAARAIGTHDEVFTDRFHRFVSEAITARKSNESDRALAPDWYRGGKGKVAALSAARSFKLSSSGFSFVGCFCDMLDHAEHDAIRAAQMAVNRKLREVSFTRNPACG